MDPATKLVKLCRKNDAQGVRRRLEGDIDVNTVDKYGFSPLQVAVCRPERYEIAEMLIEAGADVNFQVPIINAAGYHGNNVSMIKLLYEFGADINCISGTSLALSAAALNNRCDNIIYLLKLGANVNLADKSGLTTLMFIAQFDRLKMAKILLEHGADINMKNYEGRTALIFAVYFGNIKYARFLLQNNPDVNVRDNYGKTALDYANNDGKQELIDLLLEYNAK